MKTFIFLIFFISGGCGLVYEVVWSRMMQQIFGRSSLSVGVVLAAFMSGLALGSYLLGRYSDRSRNPLRLYATFEIGISVSALLATLALDRLIPVYAWSHERFGEGILLAACQFLLAFLPLIVPTLLMGATLPVLSRIVIRQLARVERELGRLYAINTVGAVAGSLLAGFFLIRLLGVHGTVYVAVAGNLAVGIAAFLASGRASARAATEGGVEAAAPAAAPPAHDEAAAAARTGDAASRTRYRIVLGAFALSGFTSFAYEIFWTRSLVFLVGNTTYAFSLMLTAFLSGIALGGYGIRFIARKRDPLAVFALIQVLIGVVSAASLPLLFSIVQSTSITEFLNRMSGSLAVVAVSNFGVALVLMLVPATLIGATLPLVGRIFLEDLKNTGAVIGKVYAVNTLGNVLGALLPGLVILPALGIQKGILLAAALNGCLAIVIACSLRRKTGAGIAVAAVAFAAAIVSLVQMPLGFQFPCAFQTAKDGVLYYREGALVTTKVWKSTNPDYKVISVDSIGIGGTSDSDYKQQVLAHLPKLLLKSYRSELTIGLGSGILAGESARHAGIQKIDCIELAHGVVEGAKYFARENYDIVNDPRAHIVIDDVADFLNTTHDKYDIISADEKTAGKYASNSMSYSTDYYRMLKEHLAPKGVVIQWMPTDLPPSQYTLAMRTFVHSFPHVALWYFPPVGRFTMSNTFMVGGVDDFDIDPGWMARELARDSQAFNGIGKYGLTSAESIVAHFVAKDDDLRRALPAGRINSFEHPYYEFYSPADYAVPAAQRDLLNHRLLMTFRRPDPGPLLQRAGSDRERLVQAYAAEGASFQGREEQLSGEAPQTVLHQYEVAMGIAPWDLNLRNEVVRFLNGEAMAHSTAGDSAGSLAMFQRAAEIYPTAADVHYDLGMMLLFLNDSARGGQELQRALAINPDLVPALRNLGRLYASHGDVAAAIKLWQKALVVEPSDAITLASFGRALCDIGYSVDGLGYATRAHDLAPRNPEVAEAYRYAQSMRH
jgi:spermidine synthase